MTSHRTLQRPAKTLRVQPKQQAVTLARIRIVAKSSPDIVTSRNTKPAMTSPSIATVLTAARASAVAVTSRGTNEVFISKTHHLSFVESQDASTPLRRQHFVAKII